MNLNPNFSNWTNKLFTVLSLIFLQSYTTNFIIFFFYLVNLILDNSTIPYGFDIRP